MTHAARLGPAPRGLVLLLFLLSCVGLLATPALAHKPSDSYLRITSGGEGGGEGEHLWIQWDISLKDLEFLVGLDANLDSQITWGELKARREAVAAHALSRLRLTADGRPVKLTLTDLLVDRHSDGTYAVLVLDTDAPSDIERLGVEYHLLFDADPTHRGLVLYTHGSTASTHILSPAHPGVDIRVGERNLWRSLGNFIIEGVWHIWIGFDHILFLLTLLFPAVLIYRDREWHGVDHLKPAALAVLKIATVFTLAHSITLWLAVMGWVTLPGWIVEAAIALSIIITAVNNLYPILPLSGWVIAFAFGLIHGFGFANVLVDLGLTNSTLAVALLGFNVGVELGQLVIILAFFPLAYALRDTAFYRWGILRGGSALIAFIALLWFIERVSTLEIIGF